MRTLLRIGALTGTVAVALAVTGSALAKTIIVKPGQSIQAAIDRAASGDTVSVRAGTYKENLTISTNDLRLQGDGAGQTVLMPAPTPAPVCGAPVFVDGICVVGGGAPVTGTRIVGLTVKGFTTDGIFAFNTTGLIVRDVESTGNGDYGMFANTSSDVTMFHNNLHDNGAPGIYVGDSPNANAVVVGNTTIHNGVGGDEGYGIFIRDSSHGVVHDNTSSNNCVGILLLDTGAPGTVSDWVAYDNTVTNNSGACVASSDAPPTSGIGIGIAGTHDTTLRHNRVTGNVPTGPTLLTAGIGLTSSLPFGGSDPTNTRVTQNDVHGNALDVLWDGSGTGNSFAHNLCSVAVPAWICSAPVGG